MYTIWQVFEDNKRTQFYVINKQTRKVQSVWSEYFSATNVMNKLNAFESRKTKAGQ